LSQVQCQLRESRFYGRTSGSRREHVTSSCYFAGREQAARPLEKKQHLQEVPYI